MQYALFYAEGADPLPYVPADDNVGDWVDELEARGVSEYGERLRPEHDATTVRVRNGEVLALTGGTWPFMGGTLTMRPVELRIGAAEERRYVLEIEGLECRWRLDSVAFRP